MSIPLLLRCNQLGVQNVRELERNVLVDKSYFKFSHFMKRETARTHETELNAAIVVIQVPKFCYKLS